MTGAARRELNPWWAAAAIARTSANPGSFTIVGYWPPCGEPSPRAATRLLEQRGGKTSLRCIEKDATGPLAVGGPAALTQWMAANGADARIAPAT
jgi:hypothetical protein